MGPFIYNPPTDPLVIVHADRDMVVVDKPPGLLSVPGRFEPDCALSRVAAEHGTVYAVHRLDMDTSGLLILALRRKAEAALHAQFRERTVEKSYLAIVHGEVKADDGLIDLPLLRQGGRPPLSVVDHDQGKPARTRYRVLDRGHGRSRLHLVPETGRTHQLRVHLLSLGHPIVGDTFYATDVPGTADEPRMLLHAATLSFAHPYSGEPVELEAPAAF
jgi:tRNA pseudouridine32 synthase/23S rRNA pseudouridine746 synthase